MSAPRQIKANRRNAPKSKAQPVYPENHLYQYWNDPINRDPQKHPLGRSGTSGTCNPKLTLQAEAALMLLFQLAGTPSPSPSPQTPSPRIGFVPATPAPAPHQPPLPAPNSNLHTHQAASFGAPYAQIHPTRSRRSTHRRTCAPTVHGSDGPLFARASPRRLPNTLPRDPVLPASLGSH